MDWVFDRESIRLIATDSGLGGLAIAAEIAERLHSSGTLRQAHIIFFNCLPSESVGFDAMASDERRCRVLSNALDAMVKRFSPDAILLACNTISAIYEIAGFAVRTAVPVIGIIKMGVDVITEHLRQEPEAQVILFAARTTVQSGVHKKMLIEKGIRPNRLTYQECAGLISAIERGPESEETCSLIRRYVAEGIQNLPNPSGPVAAALLCTHFGYAVNVFREALQQHAGRGVSVLDPNMRMVEEVLPKPESAGFTQPEVAIQVVSQVVIPKDRRDAIAAALAVRSGRFAEALRTYTYLPRMFAID